MIISRTPYRLSIFGGGTDYPSWYRAHGGAVLSATIDKYCYLSCRYLPPFFEHRYRVVYSQIENAETIDEIKHPAVRAVLQHLQIDRGVEIHHDGDLPARSGMGSSSAFTVGLLNALYALTGRMTTKHQLAQEAIHVEQEMLSETVGSQDQVSASYGGFNHIAFLRNDDFSVRPITLAAKRVEEIDSHLMLFYTGIKRTASDIADSFVCDMDSKKRQLRLMNELVNEALTILNGDQSLHLLGEMLHEAWQAKRTLSTSVSNPEVEEIYEQARAAGALGGKLTGAGGGGFMLLFVPPGMQKAVRSRLSRLIHVPFHFESSGSQVIFFDREAEYADEEQFRSQHEIRSFRELTLRKSASSG